MHFVGKILVVVQLVLSVCFMAFAAGVYAVQTNWRDVAQQRQEARDQLQASMNDLRQEYEEYRNQMTDREQALVNRAEQAEGLNRGLQNENETLQTQLETARTERDNAIALSQVSAEEARMRREEALLQREVNANLHESVDRLIVEARQLKDNIFEKDQTIRQISRRHENILEERAFLEQVVQTHGLETDPAAYEDAAPPPPDVLGLVLASRQGEGAIDWVEVSIGQDDGLTKGHELFVYRNEGRGKYLGKIKLTDVWPDRAVGTVIPRTKNGIIQEGDHVSTKL